MEAQCTRGLIADYRKEFYLLYTKKMETTHACSGASEDLWSYPKKANVISKFILILGMYNFKARRMLSESIGC